MTFVIGVLGVAVLFVAFGYLRLRHPEGGSPCANCLHHDPSACSHCVLRTESSHDRSRA